LDTRNTVVCPETLRLLLSLCDRFCCLISTGHLRIFTFVDDVVLLYN